MRDVRDRMMAGLGVVEERVMEGMRASQLRDVSEMEEMVGISDQISAVGEQMSVMSEQLGLLPSQLRLLGRQCDEVKGQLGRLGQLAVLGQLAILMNKAPEAHVGVKSVCTRAAPAAVIARVARPVINFRVVDCAC